LRQCFELPFELCVAARREVLFRVLDATWRHRVSRCDVESPPGGGAPSPGPLLARLVP
jgi:hypothetical protein